MVREGVAAVTRYAETWLDVGRLPLRRRDRAAMVLAYEMCRRPMPEYERAYAANVRVHAAMTALGMGDVSHAIWNAVGNTYASQARLVCTRLALLLRVLLRVDAGDYGSGKYIAMEASNGEWLWHPVGCPSRPLWEQA